MLTRSPTASSCCARRALVYVPGLNGGFHQSPIGPWHWLFLFVWPPVVFGAEEARKAVLRRRNP